MRKTTLSYLAIAVACIVIDRIYSLFGHGVYSAAMSLMFLIPLLGGSLLYALLGLLVPQADQVRHYRLAYNAYNSGIATLTIGSLLKGVFDIAGTSSAYLLTFNLGGWILLLIGLVTFGLGLLNRRRTILPDQPQPKESTNPPGAA